MAKDNSEFTWKVWLIDKLNMVTSRKFLVTVLVIWLSERLTKSGQVTGQEWMSMVEYVILIYVGGNVAQKGVLSTIDTIKEIKQAKKELSEL